MYKILIRNLHLLGILGVNPEERIKQREIVVNVTLFTDLPRRVQSDDIIDCINYSEIAKEIRALVDKARRFTVEALADDIANLCLNRKGAKKVIVRVDKPGAISYAESVGVEIERRN